MYDQSISPDQYPHTIRILPAHTSGLASRLHAHSGQVEIHSCDLRTTAQITVSAPVISLVGESDPVHSVSLTASSHHLAFLSQLAVRDLADSSRFQELP